MSFSLEYVLSGSTGTKICNKEFIEVPEYRDLIASMLKKINRDDHAFSILFNAYTQSEAEMVKLNDHYLPSLRSLHSDSGGLQMITLGGSITEEGKRKVYDRQAKYSDIAMSFDEIPVKTLSNKAQMGVTALRRFDRQNLKQYAVDSAKNLMAQIEHFQKVGGGRAKPLAIIHGNDVDTYIDFANYMFDTIPLDMHDLVGGLSISGQTLGEGTLEAVERAFVSCIIPHNNKKTMHLLGVGSMSRLIPYLAFMRSGLFDKDTHISYDSTTHSGGLIRREYIDGNLNRLKPGKQFNTTWERVYDDVIRVFPESKTDIPGAKVFFEASNLDIETRKGQERPYIRACIGFLCASIENFKLASDRALTSDEALIGLARDVKMERIIYNLLNIRDRKDFDEWKLNYGMHYSTDRIKDVDTNDSLEQFFT